MRSTQKAGRLFIASETTSIWRRSLAVLTLLSVAVPAAAGGRAPGPKKPVIRGRVTSVDTGQPVPGAKVAIPGVGKTRTRANGRFVIRVKRARAGTARARIRAKGHIVRETNVVVPAPGGKVVEHWNLLPRGSEGFDLSLFDAIARPDGVVRWATPPVFRIIRNRLECRGGLVNGSCLEWFASTVPVAEPMIGWLRRGASEMGTLATSGRPPRIVEVDLSPGQAIDFDDALLLENTFTLGHIVANFRSESRLDRLLPEATETKLALFGVSDSEREVREVIAEGLGFYGSVGTSGCDGVIGRGLESFFCDLALGEPTTLDLTMGRALYSRPVGNMPPDRDPLVNGRLPLPRDVRSPRPLAEGRD